VTRAATDPFAALLADEAAVVASHAHLEHSRANIRRVLALAAVRLGCRSARSARRGGMAARRLD
jgi:hypothetical protein